MSFAIVALSGMLAASLSADPGRGIVVNRQGEVYVGDVFRNTVWKIDRNGQLKPFATGVHSHWIVLDANGNLYAEHLRYDSARNRFLQSLLKIKPDGSIQTIISPSEGQSFNPPFTMDRNGNIYYPKNAQILKRTPTGRIEIFSQHYSGQSGKPGGKPRLDVVSGMAWGPDGSLYLTDGLTVRKVKPDGTSTTVVNIPPASDPDAPVGVQSLWGLTVDRNSNVYAADPNSCRILKITPSGNVSVFYRSERPWFPTGIAMQGSDFYVLEHGFTLPKNNIGPRVRKISSNGAITTLGMVGTGARTYDPR